MSVRQQVRGAIACWLVAGEFATTEQIDGTLAMGSEEDRAEIAAGSNSSKSVQISQLRKQMLNDIGVDLPGSQGRLSYEQVHAVVGQIRRKLKNKKSQEYLNKVLTDCGYNPEQVREVYVMSEEIRSVSPEQLEKSKAAREPKPAREARVRVAVMPTLTPQVEESAEPVVAAEEAPAVEPAEAA